MLISALIIFVFVVSLGLGILPPILQDRSPNKTVRAWHGFLAACGLILVYIDVVALMTSFSPLLIVSLVLLTLGALGGLILVILAEKKIYAPKVLVALHPLVAVAGLFALVIYILP
ncbi:Uncharacterised protein [Legionella donaldsonii]|uniref:Transmembrane protein n=1 Tax=Legionella donaldsonii TaxID=45060 RepID=A0A378JBA3_9GAMM|nr:hypothetical protein [Legionella donaldsonii]STX44875.1 Uncharacterised protein [Legionella donaldsonii]